MATATLSSKTTWLTPQTVKRKWYLIDVKEKVLGRISSSIATILCGKISPTFTPSTDCGDFVVLINADKILLTGNKIEQKEYFYHTLYPGGAKFVSYKKLMAERPEKAIQLAVKRMLPKTKLSYRQILRLKIYRGENHPHAAQKLERIDLDKI